MSVTMTGLAEFQRDMENAQRALQSLDGTIAKIAIDPANPKSVENAIREMEAAVDGKVAPYGNNVLIAAVVKAAKEQYRARILELAKNKQ